jgi:hypothetical protein
MDVCCDHGRITSCNLGYETPGLVINKILDTKSINGGKVITFITAKLNVHLHFG